MIAEAVQSFVVKGRIGMVDQYFDRYSNNSPGWPIRVVGGFQEHTMTCYRLLFLCACIKPENKVMYKINQ